MTTYGMFEAKTHFSQLVDSLISGRTVCACRVAAFPSSRLRLSEMMRRRVRASVSPRGSSVCRHGRKTRRWIARSNVHLSEARSEPTSRHAYSRGEVSRFPMRCVRLCDISCHLKVLLCHFAPCRTTRLFRPSLDRDFHPSGLNGIPDSVAACTSATHTFN